MTKPQLRTREGHSQWLQLWQLLLYHEGWALPIDKVTWWCEVGTSKSRKRREHNEALLNAHTYNLFKLSENCGICDTMRTTKKNGNWCVCVLGYEDAHKNWLLTAQFLFHCICHWSRYILLLLPRRDGEGQIHCAVKELEEKNKPKKFRNGNESPTACSEVFCFR